MRVLCLDIEGGYGGSSRSLYESVRHLDRAKAEVEVWCRRAGPVQARYQALGVPCRIVPEMPKVSSLPRLSRNLYAYALAAWEFRRSASERARMAREIDGRFDLVHFNHEALFLLARWLRPRTRVPFTMHIRTSPTDTPFARWQTRMIARTIDHLVFITENEQANFARLGGEPKACSAIYNIVTPSADHAAPHPAVPADGRFKVACLGNYAWVRGIDRLVEVAQALVGRGRRETLFVVAGDMTLPRSLPGELGKIARTGGTLADYAAARAVGDMFCFLGHVAEPESVLGASDALVRPSREDNPWGRDILEALAAGLPVLACGTYDKFVEDGETGVLRLEFDPEVFAAEIARLADDRERCARMGAVGRERVLRLCDGRARAAELLDVWTRATRHRALRH